MNSLSFQRRLILQPAVVVAVLLLSLPGAMARVELVTLPSRQSVQLTIYNSVDLTLVKETRFLTLRRGLNRLEFSWANTLIDPSSLELRALTHANEVEVVDVTFPPRVTNLLEWRVQSEFAGEVRIEIRYFTSGISWSADYVALAATQENQMTLGGNVRVTNNSGEDYENASLRLVVGVIRLVEDIAQLARQGRPGPLTQAMSGTAPGIAGKDLYLRTEASFARADAAALKKEIVKEELSEYFLYSVGGRDTIPNGWSKRLPSFEAKEVPIGSYYKYEHERWGGQVIRYYRFKNDQASKLGKEPLPDGSVKAFRVRNADQLLGFVGATSVKYIPINEEVELELGQDLEVVVKPRLMDWQKLNVAFDNDGNVKGWTLKERWEIELQNSKEIPVTVDVRRSFPGDWTMESQTRSEKVDANRIKFVSRLEPGAKQKITYEVTIRYGTNATR